MFTVCPVRLCDVFTSSAAMTYSVFLTRKKPRAWREENRNSHARNSNSRHRRFLRPRFASSSLPPPPRIPASSISRLAAMVCTYQVSETFPENRETAAARRHCYGRERRPRSIDISRLHAKEESLANRRILSRLVVYTRRKR